MDYDDTEDEPCEQCGLCCRIFGPGITPSVMNVYVWMERGRTDILRHFLAFREAGAPVNCADLGPEDLGSIVAIEMRDPQSENYVPVCPFLRRVAKQRYLCGIHDVKPEMCGNYQPWIWGETFFNRCPALHSLERSGRKPGRT